MRARAHTLCNQAQQVGVALLLLVLNGLLHVTATHASLHVAARACAITHSSSASRFCCYPGLQILNAKYGVLLMAATDPHHAEAPPAAGTPGKGALGNNPQTLTREPRKPQTLNPGKGCLAARALTS